MIKKYKKNIIIEHLNILVRFSCIYLANFQNSKIQKNSTETFVQYGRL